MGDSMVLLSFESKEEMLEMLEDGKVWLSEWFFWVKPWCPKLVSYDKFVWLKLENWPLHAWCYEFFRNLGNRWGVFILVNDSTMRKMRLDTVRVLTLIRKEISIPKSVQILLNERSFVFNMTVEDDLDFLWNLVMKMINKA
ncbi:hypothetical protein CRYUN_Cryun06bG0153600 [Craigia yunnanensis]